MGITITTQEAEAIRLKTTFTREGFCYRQIWRQGDVAVYEYNSRGGSFEVVIILVEGERLKFGKLCTKHEVYPTTSQWGSIWLEFRAAR